MVHCNIQLSRLKHEDTKVSSHWKIMKMQRLVHTRILWDDRSEDRPCGWIPDEPKSLAETSKSVVGEQYSKQIFLQDWRRLRKIFAERTTPLNLINCFTL